MQYLKLIQNPSLIELQKAVNQGRRCTWEKLSAIKANCGIELALDECVAVLNHMRRLRRSADRAAAAASSSSHGLPSVRFSASRRIPSWNVIARENSTGSLEEDLLNDAASSFQQGVGATGLRAHRGGLEGSDSEPENVDMNSWTRSGGPLMRTASANKFVDFVQGLDLEIDLSKLPSPGSNMGYSGVRDPFQQFSHVTTPDRSSEGMETDRRDFNSRNGSSLLVGEGDLLQAERIQDGFLLNVVKKEDWTQQSRCSEHNSADAAECLQLDCPEKEIVDASSASSEYDGEEETLENRMREAGSGCSDERTAGDR